MLKNDKVIFLPGMLCDERLWKSILVENKIPGQHLFINLKEHDTFESIIKHVLDVGGDEFHLIGFSMGGIISCEILTQYSHRIKSISLLGMSGYSFSKEDKMYFEKMISASNIGNFRAMTKRRAKTYLSNDSYQNKEMVNSVMEMANDCSKEIFHKQLNMVMNRKNHMDLIKSCKTPALIIASDKDNFNKAKRIQELTQLFKESTFIELMNCGHMIPIEKAQEVSRALKKHLELYMN